MTFYSNVKQKSYVLNPRGKPLYEDSNRFGTKMLEKMGWSKGKGLGLKEDGEQNFIRVSHKTDQKGMGYHDRDDQWTGHENAFNSLLKSFDKSENTSENESEKGDDARVGFGFASDEKKSKKSKSIKSTISGKSLEEMSKKSSVRVHYRKFTRGKDVSKYSEKDLANIFGKKIAEDSDKLEVEPVKSELDRIENNFGITTIETNTTIQDYFQKKKTESLKRTQGNEDELKDESESAAELPTKKRRKKDKEPKEDTVEPDKINATHAEPEEKKEKKKKKKSKKETVPVEEIIVSDEDSECEIMSVKMKSKKKKKKSKKCSESQPENGEMNDVQTTEMVSKKKKRDKKDSTKAKTTDSEPNTTNDEVPTNSTQVMNGILNILSNRSGRTSSSLKQSNAEHNGQEDGQALSNPTNTDGFPNSNLSELSGYGYNKEFELRVTEKSKDQGKISDLWDHALINKYGKEAVQATKAKRYSVKQLKKKNLFVKV